MTFNVIQQTFPDGHHRWKFFTSAMQTGSVDPAPSVEPTPRDPGWTVARKERENAKRAQQSIYDLARSNVHLWDWFVTLTFDPARVDRQDYRDCMSRVRYLGDQLTRRGSVYLFVPEFHKDGKSYHFHGLVGGWMPLDYAGSFGPSGYERATYHVVGFPGFTSVQPLEDPKRASTYITKYITKELVSVVPKGCHRYLYSRSLCRPVTERLSLTDVEFCSLVNEGEYFPPEDFESGLANCRFVKKVPIYYRLGKDFMYLVED